MLVRPVLLWIWTIVSKKQSLGFDWEDLNLDLDLDEMIFVRPDPEALPIISKWSGFLQINFGWKETVVVEPTTDCRTLQSYRVGFCSPVNGGKEQVCQVSVPRDKKTALSVGPQAFFVFAIDEKGNQIPIRMVSYLNKEKLSKDTFLL